MTIERLGSKETLKKVPDSVFILAHLATFGGIGDIVALATVAARLKRAGVNRVGLGYKSSEAQAQVTSLISSEINFQPLPEKLFTSELSLPDRVRGYRDSLRFQRVLLGYERVALLGASEVRFLRKSPLRLRLDTFPEDVFYQPQTLVDNYTSQLGEYYGVSNRLDRGPVEFSLPPRCDLAVSNWARETELNLSLPFWVFNLNTGSHEKTWPLDRFIALSSWLYDRTKIPTVLINLPDDSSTRQRLFELSEENSWLYLFASPEIGETAALIKKAQGYIGGDTGITHITAALGTPLVAIYPKVNLPVWEPVTAGQKMTVVSGETVKEISCDQVTSALEAHLKS